MTPKPEHEEKMNIYILVTDEGVDAFEDHDEAENLYYEIIEAALEDAEVWDESQVADEFSAEEIEQRTRAVLDFVWEYYESEELQPVVVDFYLAKLKMKVKAEAINEGEA